MKLLGLATLLLKYKHFMRCFGQALNSTISNEDVFMASSFSFEKIGFGYSKHALGFCKFTLFASPLVKKYSHYEEQ